MIEPLRRIVSVAALALLAGCGGNALTVQGHANVTTTIAGQTPTTQSFDFTRATVLEAGSGMVGSCSSSNGTWNIQLTRENPPADQFKQMTLTLPPAVAGQVRPNPTAVFVLGNATFAASGTCRDSSSSTSNGYHVVVTCTGATASGDTRVLSADVDLAFTACNQ